MISLIGGGDVQEAARRVAFSLVHGRPNGVPTATAATAGTGSTAAAKTPASSAMSGTGTDITSNDFLSLLVTEMKNQDPTAPTDPNAYISQLVGVNSLQQLISINSELGGSSTSSSGSAGANASASSKDSLAAVSTD